MLKNVVKGLLLLAVSVLLVCVVELAALTAGLLIDPVVVGILMVIVPIVVVIIVLIIIIKMLIKW